MLSDYCRQYYEPQAQRTAGLVADDFAQARQIAAWKKRLRRAWKHVEVISQTQPAASYTLSPTNSLQVEVVLQIGDLTPEDLGVEMLFATSDRKRRLHIQDRCALQPVSFEDGVATYRASVLPDRTGMYEVATRIYAKHPLLPHRQDFELVKWL
jgi:phosphorylase/glycogen(starch) synthase